MPTAPLGVGVGVLGESCPALLRQGAPCSVFPSSSGARAGGPAHAGAMQAPAFCKESGALPSLTPAPRAVGGASLRPKGLVSVSHHSLCCWRLWKEPLPLRTSGTVWPLLAYPGMGLDTWRRELASDRSDFCSYPEAERSKLQLLIGFSGSTHQSPGPQPQTPACPQLCPKSKSALAPGRPEPICGFMQPLRPQGEGPKRGWGLRSGGNRGRLSAAFVCHSSPCKLGPPLPPWQELRRVLGHLSYSLKGDWL